MQDFPKVSTGISGLDQITHGGFPQGRPILICGSAGCGKTLFSMQFLVNGILEHDAPGVFMSFEETPEDLAMNVRSLGFDLKGLEKQDKLRIDHVKIDRAELEESGEFDLEALFIRLEHAIDSIGAKRVVIDTIEALFMGIENQAVLRAEIRRLFLWLKDKGVTAVITGERGSGSLTRQGLEEYVSDCVILLDFRVIDQIATRRLRIVKYRGTTHGTNEYPFLINQRGISVLPITSLKLDYQVTEEITSTGVPELDQAFNPGGLYRGASTLLTGSAGTSKTILAGHFAMAACRAGEKALFFSFEESPDQLIRNMQSIGVDMRSAIDKGLLHIHSVRPSLQGLEMHLIELFAAIDDIEPSTVIIDPISSLVTIGSQTEVRAMLIRLLDSLKNRQITTVFTALTQDGERTDNTVEAISSLADTWIELRNRRGPQSHKRKLRIIKARGMGHITATQPFYIDDEGLHFLSHNEL